MTASKTKQRSAGIEPQACRPVGRPRWMSALLAGAIVVVTLLAYVPVIADGGFIWDDDDYVTANPYLRDAEGLAQIWVPGSTRQYYPMVFTTFWLEFQLWELNATGFHFVNLALHIANALLIWVLLARLKIPGAWLIAAVFALHPVHVESVAWITERKNVLSAAFYLLAAGAYLRFDDLRDAVPTSARAHARRWVWYALALLGFILALLSKTVACSLPAALILVLIHQRKALSLKRLAPLAPLFIVGLMLALYTAFLEREQVRAVGPDFDFTIIERFLIASKALLFYPSKLLAPWPVMFIYPRWSLDGSVTAYWPILVVLGIAALAVIAFVRGVRGPGLALAFYAGTVFPALGFFNVYPHRFSFVADHFVYLASLGVIVLVVASLAKLLRKTDRLALASVVVLLPCFLITFTQSATYENAESVWRDTLAKNDSAWMPHDNLAAILLRQAGAAPDPETGFARAEEALAHAERAVEIKPEHHPGHSNAAEALRFLGRFPEALARQEHALSLVRALHPDRRPEENHFLWKDYQRLGRIYRDLNQLDDAKEAYRQAIRVAPQRIGLRIALANIFLIEQSVDKATVQYIAILEIDPTQFTALSQLATINRGEQNYEAATDLYQRAIEAAPTPDALLRISTGAIPLLAYCPDPAYRDLSLATRLAEHCVRLTRERDPQWLGTLELLYAETGRFEEAVRAATLALQLARQHPEFEGMAEAIEQRLQSYRAGQPWREEEE